MDSSLSHEPNPPTLVAFETGGKWCEIRKRLGHELRLDTCLVMRMSDDLGLLLRPTGQYRHRDVEFYFFKLWGN